MHGEANQCSSCFLYGKIHKCQCNDKTLIRILFTPLYVFTSFVNMKMYVYMLWPQVWKLYRQCNVYTELRIYIMHSSVALYQIYIYADLCIYISFLTASGQWMGQNASSASDMNESQN